MRHVLAGGIQEQVGYISTMLDSALEFVELQREWTLNLSPTDLHSLLAGVIEFYSDQSASKHLTWETDYDPSLVVTVDATYLDRALSRILENAVQYTREGGRVRVTSAQYPHEIGIRIEDNGIGIDAQAVGKIFDPLYRANEARTEPRSGLGLAIARTIVEAHGGRIAVESTPGTGSTFEILLPIP
ncbi:MAG: HAMP domain-containing histidine kinase [Chloroflexi bacterium]|nr:HAMP domain-containing histidine kinase [Chloroflexota bacterium]